MSNCGCSNSTPCTSQECGCKFEVDAGCVRYTGDTLSCIDAQTGDLLADILLGLNNKFCDLTSGNFIEVSQETPGNSCVNGGLKILVKDINTSAIISTEYLCTAAALGSVTGLNTDNTDPLNPIVKISVDGTTVTGLGTPASPLVASGGIAGSGIQDYVARWTPDGSTLGTGLIQDNNSSVSIGVTPDAGAKLAIQSDKGSGLYILQTVNGYGLNARSIAAGGTSNAGGLLWAGNSTTQNVGAEIIATGGTTSTNIGITTQVYGGATNYAAKLSDGTEGIGKVLTCVGTAGLANWADANPQKFITYPADFTGTNYTLTSADNGYSIVVINGSTAVTITVPTALVAKMQVGFIQDGTGDVTFTPASTTLNNAISGYKIKGRYEQVYLEQGLTSAIYYLLGNTKV